LHHQFYVISLTHNNAKLQQNTPRLMYIINLYYWYWWILWGRHTGHSSFWWIV